MGIGQFFHLFDPLRIFSKERDDTPFHQNDDKTKNENISMDLTKLKGHVPDTVLGMIPDVISKFNINTELRLAHFLAQCAHESANFSATVENLNYSLKGLMVIFRKYFPTEELALQYVRQPQKIANRVYANRMGNGDEASGDGWKYRGRGFIQLTGKNNYAAFTKSIDLDVVMHPDLVATKYPLLSAAWFFSTNCVSRCDAGATDDVVKSVTRCVNGGINGLDDRIQYFHKFHKALTTQ
jgi:putative chitinase